MFEKRKESTQPKTSERTSERTLEEPKAPPSAAPVTQSRSTAVIGQTIKIKGTVSGDENLIVEGTIEGSVDLPKNDLTVGSSGSVTADLNANTVRVDGQVTGDIKGGEKVIVSKSGHVKGNITAPRVTLEDGAKFKGSIDMDPGDAQMGSPKPMAASKEDGPSDLSTATAG